MAVLAAPSAVSAAAPAGSTPSGESSGVASGISLLKTHLKHLIFIIQENRSFDSYFGTFPGADGFPSPAPCLPSQWHPSQCVTPWPDHEASNKGGPYDAPYQIADIDNGKMDGFEIQAELDLQNHFHCPPQGSVHQARGRTRSFIVHDDEVGPYVANCTLDVMGYHDGTDIPNYWTYASTYTLQDHFFESTYSSSHPAHLELFSLWTAKCTQLNPPDVDSCSANTDPGNIWSPSLPTPYLWTDLTYLMNQHNVSWKAYLDGGLGTLNGHNAVQTLWDVLPGFETVQEDGQVGNAENYTDTDFLNDAANGTLPQVSWLLPKFKDSEHPTAGIEYGEAYVTNLINAVMAGPEWNETAIFVAYDDISGFYDHEPPPFNFDTLGLGVRVPAFIVSPWVKQGNIDSQVCSTDCYAMLIEDDFMNGARLSSAGRPDPRTVYRDEETQYGNLARDFDFKKQPSPPMLLRPYPISRLQE
jgi:phospholipase C